jgi:hypothetical protein
MEKIALLLLMTCSLFLNAQNFKVETGEEFEAPRVVWNNLILDPDNSGFYFIRNKNGIANHYIIHKIDRQTSKTIYQKEIDFYVYKGFNKNGKLLLFSVESKEKTTLSNKSSEKIILNEFNSTTGERIGEPVVVDELKSNRAGQGLNYNVTFSPDNKKMLLTSEIKENEKEQIVTCRLYDTDGYKKIWEKEAMTVYKNSTISSAQYMVDNEGTLIYSFAYLRSSYKNQFEMKTDISFAVAIVSGKNNSLKIHEIPDDGKTLAINTKFINNMVICSGTFADGVGEVPLYAKRGFFMIAIDPVTLEMKPPAFNYIDEKIQDLFVSDKEKNTRIGWSVPKVFFIKDSYYAVYQHEYSTTEYNSTTLYDDEILTMRYTPENKLAWMKILPRNSSRGTTALNYITTDKLHLIYYDNPENLKKFPDPENFIRKEYKYVLLEKSVVVCSTIDENGKMTRSIVPLTGKIILEEKDPLKLFSYESKSLIIPVTVGKKMRRYDILKIQ